jgi:CRISPR/Cas system-associated endoribonuclease Cas2
MIRNPFFYRAADVQSGSMADDRVFVNLFGISALGLLKEKIQHLWEIPLILLSAPGGGKSSLMRIFTPGALKYIKETASLGGNQRDLAQKMEELGAFENGEPHALGIWLRISDEFHSLEDGKNSNKYGLFCSMLNTRIILNAVDAICELKGLKTINSNDLARISFSLKPNLKSTTISSWKKWGADNVKEVYDKMAKLESELCDMIDDPFWSGNASELSHSGLWSLDLLANLEIFLDGRPFKFRPLVMLDDVHELSGGKLKYLLNILTSRQVALPFWISMRKQALGLEEILTERIGKGVEKGRDYEVINFEDAKEGDFNKRARNIATLRVESVRAQIGALSQEFESFLSDDREEILLENLDQRVVEEIKKKILAAAGEELERFETVINDVEKTNEEIKNHELCRRLRKLEILIQREVNKVQKSFLFSELSSQDLKKHENNSSITEAAELFLAEEYKLPYYFSARRLVTLSSGNIQQFLRLAGGLFEEIMTAIRLGRDGESFLSPERQDSIIRKVAGTFFKEIPVAVPNGSSVFQFITAIAEMCKQETYRSTAPYAPGVTGTAFYMNEYEFLKESAKKGDEKSKKLYRAIESAVAHNILEPESNYKCKGKKFLVLYLNRLLCVPFNLPLQRGGFREQKLGTFFQWMEIGYKKTKESKERYLWD